MNNLGRKLRYKIATIKFQFDMSTYFFTFINFSLLVVAVSDKIQIVWDVSVYTIWIVFVPGAIVCTWLFGLIIDKLGYQTEYYKVANERTPQVMETLAIVKQIQKDIKSINNDIHQQRR